jgi:flagellar biogenesis protein FliO
MEKLITFLMSRYFITLLIVLAGMYFLYKIYVFKHRNESTQEKISEKDNRNNGGKNNDQKNITEEKPLLLKLQEIGAMFAMFLFIILIIFLTKSFFKSQGGVKNVLRETFVGEKTPAEITADSLHQIDVDIANDEKARKKAEDEYIADEYGMGGSLIVDFIGKHRFRGKSNSQESEDTEDLTNSVPSKKFECGQISDGQSKQEQVPLKQLKTYEDEFFKEHPKIINSH